MGSSLENERAVSKTPSPSVNTSRLWWLRRKLETEQQSPPAPLPPGRRPGVAATPGAQALTQGIHALTYGLLVVVVATAGRRGMEVFSLVLALAVAFGVVYLLWSGKYLRLKPWQSQAWVLVLSCLWVALIPLENTSLYLVFPLYFLYLRIMPDARGIIAVLAATLISIFSQYQHLTAGTILGPTVAALVSISIDYAFRTLWKVSGEREELIAQLLETRHRLAETERAQGIATERQRIAHEIHDTLAQGLSSIQMLLYVADQEARKLGDETQTKAVTDKIALAKQVAADNLGEARAMIAALSPAALETTSLHAALDRAAEAVIGVDVDVVVEGEPRPLPMRHEATLLRIAQGALGNVAQHSHATRARVTLTFTDEDIRLDVVDNGDGFDPATLGQRPAGLGHIGISAMRQRASELGGTLSIESSPGGGCAISVVLPT